MEGKPLDLLAIGAHPDDVELAIGGTLLKLADKGYRTGVLDITGGELGTRGKPEIRAQEAAQAALRLKLTLRDNLGLPDAHVVNNETTQTAVVRVIRRYRPGVIFTHYWEDPHPDHARTSQLVTEASYLAGLVKFDADTGLDRHRPNVVAHFLLPHKVAPSFVVDITAYAADKLEAIRCYRSQLYNSTSDEPQTYLSARSFLRRIEARQRYYGAIIDVEQAEAFYVRQALNVDDPLALLTRTMSLYS